MESDHSAAGIGHDVKPDKIGFRERVRCFAEIIVDTLDAAGKTCPIVFVGIERLYDGPGRHARFYRESTVFR